MVDKEDTVDTEKTEAPKKAVGVLKGEDAAAAKELQKQELEEDKKAAEAQAKIDADVKHSNQPAKKLDSEEEK